MDGERPRALPLDEAPDAPLLVVLGSLPRKPVVNIAGAGNLPGDEMSAEPGREHAQPGELPGVALGAGEGQVSPERDPAEPQRAALYTGRREHFLRELREPRAAATTPARTKSLGPL